MSNPAPTLNQINAFNATQGTTIDFNIIGGTEVIRSNKIYIYDLSDNSLICTHLYVSTESIHELPPNTSSSIVYASGKSSADFTNNTQYYVQIQTFTDVGGTQGGSGLSIAKLFWCLPTPTLTLSTIPTTISTTSYNVSATYTPNTSGGATNEIQQFQFNLYSGVGALLQTSGVVLYGDGVDLSYNFSGLEVDSTYYVTLDVTTTQGMNVSAQSNTFTVSIDTPTMGSASVVNNGCDGYISVTSNLSSEHSHSYSVDVGEIMSFTTDSPNDITKLQVDLDPVQDLHGYDKPWVGGAGVNKYNASAQRINTGASASIDGDTITATANNGALVITGKNAQSFPAGTYTCSAIGTNADGFVIWRYTVANNTETQVGSMATTRTFTVDEPFYLGISITSAKWGQTVVGKIQLEEGSTATAWTPWENICPITGWTGCEVTNGGVNLFNGEYDVMYKLPAPIPKRTWVTASAKTTLNTQIYYYDINGDYIDYYTLNVQDPNHAGRVYRTFQMSQYESMADVYYIRFQNALATEMQLELSYENALPSAYESPTTYPITWQTEAGTVYGGTVDVVTGVLTVDRASVDLGTLNWVIGGLPSSQSGVRKRMRTTALETLAKHAASNNTQGNIICSIYSVISYNGGYVDVDILNRIAIDTDGDVSVFVAYNDYETATAFKTAMNGVQLVYELATPIEISLTPQQMQTLSGQNNIWSNTNGGMFLIYQLPITSLLVKRRDVADVSGKWLTLYSTPITQASDMDFTFIDFLNQYGKTYQYALVPVLAQDQSGVVVQIEGGYTVSDNVNSIFDGVYIADQTNVERVKAGVGYGNIDMNQGVGSITPIGSKYPIVITNSQNQYHNGSIRGTIVPNDFYSNGNLSRIDMVNKRDELEQFLTNKRAKIIKDWNGKMWLVMIMSNVSCSFDDNYGMGMVSFSADWLEVGDPTNQQDLYNAGLINVGGV